MTLLEQLKQQITGKPTTRVLGIDLGTTNSTVAEVVLPSEGEPLFCDCLALEQATQMGPYTGSLIPSIVAIDKGGEVWVGEGAKRMRAEPLKHGLVVEKNLFYETKNEVGLKKRYHRAPEEFDHARKVAGHLLTFMMKAARKASANPATRTVVTVPASFQVNQRADTLEAAKLGGIQLSDFDLLDEPVAALTDYLFSHPDKIDLTAPRNIMVFDFGGGTCDVFLARISPSEQGSAFNIETLSVSRYTRLGGGDLDAAIIHEALIPQLLAENELSPRHFEWAERKKILEPALRGCAEALKEGLCRDITQLQLHKRYDDSDKSQVVARQAPTKVTVGKRDYLLAAPSLSAATWEEILKPFLDEDMMHVRQSDYTMALSIFAPITDAMDRANVLRSNVDCVLLAGGSSLIPQVQTALKGFLTHSDFHSFSDATGAQTAIARGAAWHAAWMAAFNQPLVRPVVSNTLALRVEGHDPIILVKNGSPIPFPSAGDFKMLAGLSLPKTFTGTLRIEIIALPDENIVLRLPIQFNRSEAGEPINFEYKFSSGRSFDCRVALRKKSDETHEVKVENPLVSVSNPGAARIEIEQIEEELREAGSIGKERRTQLMRLGKLYEEIKMPEKACEVLKMASRAMGEPDPYILNRMGMIYDSIGDYNRMEAHYGEAARVSGDWAGPLFNWALHLMNHKRFDDALQRVDEGILKEPQSGPFYILRANILQKMDQTTAAKDTAREGLRLFPSPEEQSRWELGWYRSGASMLDLKDEVEAAKKAQNSNTTSGKTQTDGGDLPVIS